MMKKHNYQRMTFYEFIKELHFCLPGIVISFDPSNQRAQIQPSIERVDVSGWSQALPAIIDVPVFFAGGSGFHVETQVSVGDEGVIHFSQRCLDVWKQTGGIAKNTDGRILNLTDAFFTTGFRSNPNIITGFSNDGVKVRNKDGSHYYWLKSDGTTEITNGSGVITMSPDGVVTINGVTFSTDGKVNSPSSVTAPLIDGTDDVSFGGISAKGHRHGGVETGGGTSGGPV